MAQSKRLFSRTSPHNASPQSETVPWTVLTVVMLLIIIVVSLWGKIPKRPHFPHETPAGNGSGFFKSHPFGQLT
jgi:hypothetical protein